MKQHHLIVGITITAEFMCGIICDKKVNEFVNCLSDMQCQRTRTRATAVLIFK